MGFPIHQPPCRGGIIVIYPLRGWMGCCHPSIGPRPYPMLFDPCRGLSPHPHKKRADQHPCQSAPLSPINRLGFIPAAIPCGRIVGTRATARRLRTSAIPRIRSSATRAARTRRAPRRHHRRRHRHPSSSRLQKHRLGINPAITLRSASKRRRSLVARQHTAVHIHKLRAHLQAARAVLATVNPHRSTVINCVLTFRPPVPSSRL